MTGDTVMTLSLQSIYQNDEDEWMDAGDKDIDGIIQQLDYKDKSKEKNPPSAIKSSLQQSLSHLLMYSHFTTNVWAVVPEDVLDTKVEDLCSTRFVNYHCDIVY
eukprot:2266776-Ditylum_brightwellii.AAC.1